ncbi:hypothetical protein [Clostridium beijerinckii]|uniref:hypothetical protein n=1 Tax=Clostridium beijerinckii TaxID=1520 RepID=UPI001494C430|nr:hypothetical protein [Clostridium beijerinckii]NOW03206.1 hypothetical protein [Clostridium beijerinckii]NYC03652.1 hypothetical protein [Clostridium beijerinckii]
MLKENIIKTIEEKYDNEYKLQKALNDAEELIVDYFKDLEKNIKYIIKVLPNKISIEYKNEDQILNFKVENEGMYFKRCEGKIEVFSYCPSDNKISPHKIITIEPYPDFNGCKCGGYELCSNEINALIGNNFNFFKSK